jgi:HSP20 family protein
MKLIRRTNNLFPTVPSFFDDFLTKELSDWSFPKDVYGTTQPAVNILENEDGYTVEVAAPGLKKDDFNIELENDVLTISSEQKNKDEKKVDGYSRREFRYANFKRSFTLPENKVNGDKVSAKYENGVLYISLPIREEAKPKPVRTIKIG